MNMDEIRKMHQQKEHLMRHEGKHPANYSREDRYRMAEMHKNAPENMPSVSDYNKSPTDVEIL